MIGARVTDAVEFFRQRQEHEQAFAMVRHRTPDGHRWRRATAKVAGGLAPLTGRRRERLVEPLRELVFDLRDPTLRREVVLDARRAHLDLDRGEILPVRTYGELRRAAFLVDVDLRLVEAHVALVPDFDAPIDVAGVVVVARALEEAFSRRARRLALELPLQSGEERLATPRELGMLGQVARDEADARRYRALSTSLL